MRTLTILLSIVFGFQMNAQSEISGKVTDTRGNVIVGANVYLEGTYDGSTTNDQGGFKFSTSEEGTQTLVISYLSYETFNMAGDVSYVTGITVKLHDDVGALDAVVLSAGTFEAGIDGGIAAGALADKLIAWIGVSFALLPCCSWSASPCSWPASNL